MIVYRVHLGEERTFVPSLVCYACTPLDLWLLSIGNTMYIGPTSKNLHAVGEVIMVLSS